MEKLRAILGLQRVVSRACSEVDNIVIKNLVNSIPERNFQINRSGINCYVYCLLLLSS
uniref:Transposase n=1 Tax=Heterorhabditis bacteriophora TaxID=37862 RepID=A0A1I7W833_HETBA